MRRIAHGSTSPSKSTAHDGADADFDAAASDQSAGIPFGHLFPDLAKDDASLLPRSSVTLDNLARLGDAMVETTQTTGAVSKIPSAYTYFGQFLDHDITFTKVPKTPRDLTDSCMLGDSLLVPWDATFIEQNVKNKRARILELDSVYGGKPPMDGDKLFELGRVTRVVGGGLPPDRDEFQDVPRGNPHSDAAEDRVAQIGDRRNDQSVLISQLHVAFLRAHNEIVRRKQCSFDEARDLLRQHYHWIIVNDYLKQVTAAGTVEAVLADPAPLYPPEEREFFLPLEFTAAAFRFGHSMIRSFYYLNGTFPSLDLAELFTLRALKKHSTLPEDAVILWRPFLGGGFSQTNLSRLIDTRLVDPLRKVLDEKEQPVPCETRLSVLDLKRGYMMRIPTGQAVAQKLGLHVMTATEIEDAVKDERQIRLLREGGFLERTPLWFYILAEAANVQVGGGGNHLGPVGSRLVAEVLLGLIRRSQPSILSKTNPPWTPKLPGKVAGKFDLADLLRLAGVLHD
jgi:hypothetical protein